MQEAVLITHVVVGVLFIFFVLVQDKGTGFGTAVGGAGGGGFYASQRGAAKVLHKISMFLAAIFLLSAVVYVMFPGQGPAVDINPEGIEATPINANTPGVTTTPVSPDAPGVELGGLNAVDTEGGSVNVVSPGSE